MLDWLKFRAAAKEIRRMKRNQMEMERARLWQERLDAKDEVIKAVRMTAGAYEKALQTYVSLEEDGTVQRIEKPTSGEWHELALSMVDTYAPGMLKGALKGAVLKNKVKINEMAEKLIEERVLSRVGEMEEKGEIKRVGRNVLEANR